MLRVPGNVSVDQKQSHVESATLPPTMGCALDLKQQGTRPFCSHRSVSRLRKYSEAMRRRRRQQSCKLLRWAGPANRTSSGFLPIRDSSALSNRPGHSSRGDPAVPRCLPLMWLTEWPRNPYLPLTESSATVAVVNTPWWNNMVTRLW